VPSLRVVQPGFQTTVQDLGRFGYAHFGISASGAADPVSLRLGNRLVGNRPEAPALEMTLVGGEFEFEARAVAAVTGSDFSPEMDGKPFPLWTPVPVQKGHTIRFAATRNGARCYLCVQGGLQITSVMGSTSTHLFSGVGGQQGRSLRKGDLLPYPPSAGEAMPPRQFPAERLSLFEESALLRVTEGVQLRFFSPETRRLFSSSWYEVSEEANRMGLLLNGPQLHSLAQPDMVTEGVPLGAVQISGDGLPILLFVDHQTTGGYPKIANVISADLHRVGQLRPRNRVRFQFVTLQEAWSLLQERESLLNALFQESA
jgi:antagonist of KipI